MNAMEELRQMDVAKRRALIRTGESFARFVEEQAKDGLLTTSEIVATVLGQALQMFRLSNSDQEVLSFIKTVFEADMQEAKAILEKVGPIGVVK